MSFCIGSFLIGIIVGILLFLLVLFIWGHIALNGVHGIGTKNSSAIEIIMIKIGFGFLNFISVFSPPLRDFINMMLGGNVRIGGPAPSAPVTPPTQVPPADNVATFLGGYY